MMKLHKMVMENHSFFFISKRKKKKSRHTQITILSLVYLSVRPVPYLDYSLMIRFRIRFPILFFLHHHFVALGKSYYLTNVSSQKHGLALISIFGEEFNSNIKPMDGWEKQSVRFGFYIYRWMVYTIHIMSNSIWWIYWSGHKRPY